MTSTSRGRHLAPVILRVILSAACLGCGGSGQTKGAAAHADESAAGWCNAKERGAAGNGAADDAPALASAEVSAETPGGGEIFLPPGVYRIARDFTTRSGLRYRFAPGARLSVDRGRTFTFASEIEAAKGLTIFSGAGTVAFAFGSQREVYPDWWGAGTDALPSACAAAHAARIPVQLLPHRYDLGTTGLTISSPFAELRGAGAPTTDFISVISGATNAGPIVLTVARTEGLVAGQPVFVTGVGGDTAANGYHRVEWKDASHVALAATNGNGTYLRGTGAIADGSGTVITYEGSGTAIAIGIDVGVGSTFLGGVKLQDIRIQTVDASAVGLDLWRLNVPLIERVHVWGPASGGQYGMRVSHCIQPRIVQCNIRGEGSQTAAHRLPVGMLISDTTAAKIDQGYVHGCQTAVRVATSFVEFSSSVLENNGRGFLLDRGAETHFESCHWEDNGGGDGSEGVGLVGSGASAYLTAPAVVLYANTSSLFTLGTGSGADAGGRLRIDGGYVAGDTATASFLGRSVPPGFVVELNGVDLAGGPAIAAMTGAGVPIVCSFAKVPGFSIGQSVHVVGAKGNTAANGWHRVVALANANKDVTLSGLTGNGTYVPGTGQMLAWGVVDRAVQSDGPELGDWRTVTNSTLNVARYTFLRHTIAAGFSGDAPLAGGAPTVLSVSMPMKGWIVGLEAYYSVRAASGTVRAAALVNGALTALDTETVSAATLPVSVHRTITSVHVEAGERLSCTIATSGSFAPSGGDLTVDVFVAFGDGP